MPKFQLTWIQSGANDGEPFEADSLEDAQRIVLEDQGLAVEEVKE